jgi:hypothetical protein
MSENEKQKSLTLIISAAIIALAMGLGLNQVGSGFASRSSEGISVTGSARINVSADKAVWTLNAEQIAPTISESVKKVASATKAVMQYLIDGGIPSDLIELGSISAYGQEEYVNGNSTGRILNYRGSRSITVRSDDVQLIKKLSNGIGALLQSGVSVTNYGPQFYVSKLNELRPELLKQAMDDAQVRAKAIVEATGGKVGNVMSVRSGPFQVTSPDSVEISAGGYYDTSTIEKTITSTVTVAFKVD